VVSNLTFYEETTGLLLLKAGNNLAQNLIVFDKMNNEVLGGTDRLAKDCDFDHHPLCIRVQTPIILPAKICS
jgi:hypothetical protein